LLRFRAQGCQDGEARQKEPSEGCGVGFHVR
jgi:hypothetical protein